MQIYLLKDLAGKGKKGEIINVNDGYGKNFIIKNKIGEVATPAHKSAVEAKKQSNEYKKAEEIKEIKDIIARLAKTHIKLHAQVGATAKLFGAITSTEIANELKKHNFEIDKRAIMLTEPIKALGAYRINVKFNYGLEGALDLTVEPK